MSTHNTTKRTVCSWDKIIVSCALSHIMLFLLILMMCNISFQNPSLLTQQAIHAQLSLSKGGQGLSPCHIIPKLPMLSIWPGFYRRPALEPFNSASATNAITTNDITDTVQGQTVLSSKLEDHQYFVTHFPFLTKACLYFMLLLGLCYTHTRLAVLP